MPIDMTSFPIREFRKSRDLAWDPTKIDFTKDRADWAGLASEEREFLLRMVVGFLVGERGVTHDLAPLQGALRGERGRMEEEMYLTAQLFEEAQHVEFFQLWMNATITAVPGAGAGREFPVALPGDLFKDLLPEVMGALRDDPSPEAQMRASCLYHMIVEGVIGETGYQIFYNALEKRGLMPGLVQGVHSVHRDEARHIAFGIYFLQRLLRENPRLETFFDECMEEFRSVAEDMPLQIFSDYKAGAVPFGLNPEDYVSHNRQLFASRIQQVKKGHLVSA